ncbi:MAG TPA: family 43 glycosylhydrolase [Pyrinomonadaceae bacterium]|jgi:alpha-N-arabinofuranosidase
MTRHKNPRRLRPLAALALAFLALSPGLLRPAPAGARQQQQPPTRGFDNPVIPGMASDPSVTRAGEDYYLVTSTFEYFPGVPVYHSRDLVHWRLVGHALTRPSQLPLVRLTRNGGVWAPTIRHHEGTFYMVTTLKTEAGGNFFVTAKDPAGPWSEPVKLDQGGIDPSLFFDDDGRVYLTTGGGECAMRICQSEIDPKTGRRLSDIRPLWSGTGGSSPEGPHLYKKDGFYYLVIAEGGTEYGHMVTVARGRGPWGPFESNPRNPVLTHRDFKQSPIQATGHADLVQTHDGGWWAVFHGIRPASRQAHHTGRETYLTPVTWSDDGWPVFNGTGTVTPRMDVKTLPPRPWPAEAARDDFAAPGLAHAWSFVRNLDPARLSLTERPGWLRLKGSAVTLDDAEAPPVFVARRQQHLDAEAVTQLDFNPARVGEEAGLAIRQNERHHYEIGVRRAAAGAGREVYLRYRVGGVGNVAAAQGIGDGPVRLRVRAHPEFYRFSYAVGGGPFRDLGGVETRYLASEVANGFNGVFVGPFATGRGREAAAPADFDWFDYAPAADPPLPPELVAEQKTLPPGYNVFSVETAERGLLRNYPFVTRLPAELPPGVRARPGVTYARYGAREMRLDLFSPAAAGEGRRPAVIVVHGGAWITGNHRMENPFAAELARRGYVAATVEYRLSKEARYPAQIHDLKAAVRFLRANAARYGIDPERVAAVGASSGGHLVALLGATNGMKNFEGDGGNPSVSSAVQAVVDIDGTATFVDPGNIEKEKRGPLDTNTRLVGATYDERPDLWREASPITHVHRGSAPVLFINSSAYRPFQQREEMMAKLLAAGVSSEMVVVPDTPHPFWLFRPWFDQTILHVEEFLKKTL